VEAKNGDELFREEDKFNAGNGKTQACSQGALPLFILGLVGLGGGEGEEGRFSFIQVPSMLPNMFSIAPQFYPIYALANVVLLSPI
jgi:hypothetical protein